MFTRANGKNVLRAGELGSKYSILIEAKYRDIMTVDVTAICGIEGGEMFVIFIRVATPCGLVGGC